MKRVYLGHLTNGDYELGTNLQKFNSNAGWDIDAGFVVCLCAKEEVHKLTSIREGDLKLGRVRKVKLTLELA